MSTLAVCVPGDDVTKNWIVTKRDTTDDADDDGYLQQFRIQLNYLKCIKFDGACSLDRNETNLKLCYN